MIRETKVQRDARQARQQEELKVYHKQLEQSYPGRVMMAVKRALAVGVDLYNADAAIGFNFITCGRDFRITMELPMEWSLEADSALDNIQYELKDIEFQLAEERRKSQLRKEAMAKLTPEEIEALGL